jgi:general secretion pathway protein D
LLGDIPLLGWLFRFQSRQVEKLNLLVFLTPHIIKDDVDVVELNQRKAADVGTLQRENRIEEPTRLKQDVIEHLEPRNQQATDPPAAGKQVPASP